jgi:glycosyltransferase involved in cell wall biosynthesis
MRFSLLIVTKERTEALRDALECAARALPADGEVVVVDGDANRSAEPVTEDLRERHPGVRVRYVASAPGAAHQRNVALDAATGDVVVYVDDDCTFEPGLFEAFERVYRDPEVVGATGKIGGPLRPRLGNDPHSRLRRLVLGGGRQGTMSSFGFRRPIVDVDDRHDVEFMPGPLMSARREIAAEVRFDERLTGYSLVEDDDFSYRLSRRGRIRYEPSAVVYHHEYRWGKRDQRKMDHLQIVNRTYLFRKNFPQTISARLGFAGLMLMFCTHRLINREWAGLRGLLGGMAEARRTGGGAPVSSQGTA